MLPTISDATRVTESSSTLIDNISCNLRSDFEADGYVLNTAISDYHAQILRMNGVDISVNGKETKFCFKRIFSKNKMSYFKFELQNVDWMSVYECDSVDDAYNTFLNIFKNNFNQIFVVKKINTTRKGISWFTTGIRVSCRNKRIL